MAIIVGLQFVKADDISKEIGLSMMTMMTMMPISMIMRHLTGFKSVFFGFKPLEHSVIVAEVGGGTVSNSAAGKGGTVWLSCSFDGNASSVHRVETHQGEVESSHVQLHAAFVVTLKVPNQSLRYSNWQSSRFPWSPIMVMSSTVVLISTALRNMVVMLMAVMWTIVVMVVVGSSAFHNMLMAVMWTIVVVVVVGSTAFHNMLMAVMWAIVVVVVVGSSAFHNMLMAVMWTIVVVVVVVVGSSAFHNMLMAVMWTIVVVVVVGSTACCTVFHIWWWQFECTSGCCACVCSVAPPVDAKLVLVTMVVYVTI